MELWVIILTDYIKQAPMNELPIVILSKQLKYSLAADKVKTLEKAIELLPKLSQAEQAKKKTIEGLAKKYNMFKLNVANEFQRMNSQSQGHLLKGQSTQEMPKYNMKSVDLFYQFIMSNCICQIYGPKGCGKTALLLHFAEQFAKAHKAQKKARVLILNCVSGITPKRLQYLSTLKQEGMKIECLEIGQPEEIVKQLCKVKQQQKQCSGPMFIGIDMIALLLMCKQKPKSFITKIFSLIATLAKEHQTTSVFTNLIQHKYQLGSEQLYNHASYYCQSTAEYLMYKLYLERPEKNSANRFKFINMKGKKMEGYFSIDEAGLKDLKTTTKQ